MKKNSLLIIFCLILCPAIVHSAQNEKEKHVKKNVIDVKPEKVFCEQLISNGCKLIENLEYDKAILQFKKALIHNPFSGEAYYGLGYCYKKIGLYDKAEKNLKLGINYKKKLDSYIMLGLIYKYKGKYELARDLFLEVLNENPKSKKIISFLEEMEKVDKELLKEKQTK